MGQVEDYYEGRIATLRTGIQMTIGSMQPSLLSSEQKLELSEKSLKTLLDSDLDKALAWTDNCNDDSCSNFPTRSLSLLPSQWIPLLQGW